jgi:hypothetical protein
MPALKQKTISPLAELTTAKIIPWKGLVEGKPKPAGPRPMTFWLDRYPPGWVSRHEAASADPLALAGKIQILLTTFLNWLRKPSEERWDTFALQALSAGLFNCYLLERNRWPKRKADVYVSLLELEWPPGSEPVQRCLADLRELLGPPLSVFKAVRCAVAASDVPTREEFQRATQALEHAQLRLVELAGRLERAIANALSQQQPAEGPSSQAKLPSCNASKSC